MADNIHDNDDGALEDDDFDVDSLFDSNSPITERFSLPIAENAPLTMVMAQRTAPPIPGLFFNPSILISSELADELSKIAEGYFGSANTGPGSINQVMLFGRVSECGRRSGLPPFLDTLILALSSLLKPLLPAYAHDMLFSPAAPASRQAILNHYTPGEGITPHVDLLSRFADGIVGVSLGSGTVMTFRPVEGDGEGERRDVYLPERSVLVLTGDARYKWTHGIEQRVEDWVEKGEGQFLERRGTRVSITLRWLLPGADIVGGVE